MKKMENFNILEIQSLIVLLEEKIHKTPTGRNNFHQLEKLKKILLKVENIHKELLQAIS